MKTWQVQSEIGLNVKLIKAYTAQQAVWSWLDDICKFPPTKEDKEQTKYEVIGSKVLVK